MNCLKCDETIPFDDYGISDNSLFVRFAGGYGDFRDDLFEGPFDFALCHECAHDLADWLGLDVHNWHTHRISGNQHPDHHD